GQPAGTGQGGVPVALEGHVGGHRNATEHVGQGVGGHQVAGIHQRRTRCRGSGGGGRGRPVGGNRRSRCSGFGRGRVFAAGGQQQGAAEHRGGKDTRRDVVHCRCCLSLEGRGSDPAAAGEFSQLRRPTPRCNSHSPAAASAAASPSITA